ncbi:MAG: TetR/AcrR family transcriptional regulator [Spirochaetales bacterium]|nr:TetR/AcrR family transcriptional regulator [Spirochaetales bacterium]
MARSRDEAKRNTILLTSKRLFASRGFFNTSISDIVKETGFPVGTIYTYFQHKENIIQVIVEEGWKEFYINIKQIADSDLTSIDKLRTIVEKILPELLLDVDLINILLTEALQYTSIESKIDKLTDIIFSIIKGIPGSSQTILFMPKTFLRTSIIVFFLGILQTAKLSETKEMGITHKDIVKFTKSVISQSMGVKL